jgi:hypothetical protein
MVDLKFIPEFAAAGVFILSAGAEAIHMIRIRRLASLAFGPKSSPAFWVKAAAPPKLMPPNNDM